MIVSTESVCLLVSVGLASVPDGTWSTCFAIIEIDLLELSSPMLIFSIHIV